MSDLVERLREREKFAREETTATSLGDALHFEEAADRIEALEAEVAFLREANQAWADSVWTERRPRRPAAGRSGRDGDAPVAYVPLHPRLGPLWPNTYPSGSEVEPSTNYPRMALYSTGLALAPEQDK